jgi:hypothetical protein
MYIKWICMCTVMFKTQPDAPPCAVWHVTKHLWCNCNECLFHSSAKSSLLWQKRAATCPLIMPHRVVWCGMIRTKCWSGQLCRCWWAMVSPGAQIMPVQNVIHSEDKLWRSSIMLSTSPCGGPPSCSPRVLSLSCDTNYTANISALNVFTRPLKK